MERLEKKAITRERVESLLSKMANVADGGGCLLPAVETERVFCELPGWKAVCLEDLVVCAALL